MHFIADTHLHIYNHFDFELALHCFRANLLKADKNATQLGMFAEPSPCNFYNQIAEKLQASGARHRRIKMLATSVHVCEDGFPDIYFFPGQQIISHEKIEILCLLKNPRIPDGLPAQLTIERINQTGGIAVLAWSPGKWFFSRGRVIEKLITENNPGFFLIGDTTLRPVGWPLPRLMKKAVQKGFRVIYGSDPLPVPGEEKMAGRYACAFSCDFNSSNPGSSIREYLLNGPVPTAACGRRGGIFSTLSRLIQHAQSKNNDSKPLEHPE